MRVQIQAQSQQLELVRNRCAQSGWKWTRTARSITNTTCNTKFSRDPNTMETTHHYLLLPGYSFDDNN